ncbi:MAG: hypothetical protein ACOY3Y_08375, partial [Acidobacteriota bacterium]
CPPARVRRWPALPRTRGGIELLVRARSRRPLAPAPATDPDAILARLDAREVRWLAGEGPVRRALEARLARASRTGRDAYLLFGTFHDSALQVESFRRLIGPGGIRGLDAIVVEQFDADGGWDGLPTEAQTGDGPLLARYLARGEPEAYAALAARQERDDYTAWKYGYLPSVMDLVASARAAGTPLLGCDMPRALQLLVANTGSELYRLRELHCLFALEEELGARRTAGRGLQVAMLWGQDHVKPHGVRRFLPRDALVLSCYLLGGRPGSLTPEAQLARRLVLNDPVLLPLDREEREVAILLPGADLGGEVDRARDWLDLPATPGGRATVRAHSTEPGLLRVGALTLKVGAAEASIALPAGEHAYLFSAGPRRIAGAVQLRPGESAVFSFEPARRRSGIVYEGNRRD